MERFQLWKAIPRPIKWFISGAPATALGWIVFAIFSYGFGWPRNWAIVAGSAPAAYLGFRIQKDLIFENQDHGWSAVFEFLTFVLVKGFLFCLNLLWLGFLTDGIDVHVNLHWLDFVFVKQGLHVNKMVAFIVGPVIFTGASYLSSTRIFRKKNNISQ